VRLRFLAVPLAGLALIVVGALVFGDLNGSLVYYLTPAEAQTRRAEFDDGRRFRLAGLVEQGTATVDGETASFVVADGSSRVRVLHRGVPPQLFQEGIEVVVEGAWDGDVFRSDTMLVKHDEQYYPPDERAEAPS
jgi:cytochrome c-type biogenesis protein CcmE